MSKGRKKTKNYYFTSAVDDAIKVFNVTEDQLTRDLIYRKEIQPAFEKLAENIIHTFKFYYTDGISLKDLQHDVVSFLIEKLQKFTSDKGKAFSYFSIVAKNYLILNNNKNYKKLTDSEQLEGANGSTYALVVEEEPTPIDFFIQEMIDYYDTNLENCFPKKNDQAVANAVLELFRKKESLEIFNKKALYIYIREMTDANTQQVTKVIKQLKEKYVKMYNDYDRLGFVPKSSIY